VATNGVDNLTGKPLIVVNLSWRTTAEPRKSCPNYHVRTENVHFLKVAEGQWHLTIDITRRKSPLISSIKYKK